MLDPRVSVKLNSKVNSPQEMKCQCKVKLTHSEKRVNAVNFVIRTVVELSVLLTDEPCGLILRQKAKVKYPGLTGW